MYGLLTLEKLERGIKRYIQGCYMPEKTYGVWGSQPQSLKTASQTPLNIIATYTTTFLYKRPTIAKHMKKVSMLPMNTR
jgi:DICT domain-containing protein